MQYVDDDMDNLFRRAAEGYPLKTDAANWDKFKALMDKDAALTQIEAQKQKQSKRRLLWLLLLIPFAFICMPYHHLMNTLKNQSAVSKNNQPNTSLKEITNATSSSIKQKENLADKNLTSDQQNKISEKLIDDTKKQTSAKAKTNLHYNSSQVITASASKTSDVKHFYAAAKKMAVSMQRSEADNHQSESDISVTAKTDNYDAHLYRTVDLSLADSSHQTTELANPFIPAFSAVPADKKNTAVAKPLKLPKQQHFYAGIAVAPDVTTVKMQSVKQAGYNIGMIAGYTLNKRWSIETGFFYEKKFYYTRGESYKIKDYVLPPYTTLNNVNGGCTMYEIPLFVKYNFAAKKKHSFFVTGGLSSYIMKAENYDLNYLYDYQGYVYDYSYSIKNTDVGNYWLSVASFSIGMEMPVKNYGKFRIEPYIRTPLKGVGSGELNIMSSGLQLSFTRRFF